MSEKVALLLVLSFIVLTAVFGAAVILVPSFSQSGATIVGIILGAYVSLLGGAGVGAYLTREIRQGRNREDEK